MFMSTAAEPRPTVPLMLSNADTWRRLPLSSTSVWSGFRPRSVAGRVTSEPSAIEGCGKLNEGTSWFSVLLSSPVPDACSALPEMTSIGTGLSIAVRLATRLPMTTIWLAASSLCADVSAVASWLGADCTACDQAGAAKTARDAGTATPASKIARFMIFPCFARLSYRHDRRHFMSR